MEEEWWIDYDTWPGPGVTHNMTLGEAFQLMREKFRDALNLNQVFIPASKLAGKNLDELSKKANDLNRGLNATGWNNHFHFDAPPPKAVFTPPKAKTSLKHGPYGGGFDRRGGKF